MITNYSLFQDTLNPKFCDLICETAQKYPEESWSIYKNSRVRLINENKHPEITFILNTFVNNENLKSFGFDLSYGPSALQYAEYGVEEHDSFGWHIDSLYDNNFISDRKLTLYILLNNIDEYSGGDLYLENLEPKFNSSLFQTKGSMIIFPSYTRHCINKINYGVKKTLTVYYNGPRFR